MNRITSYINYLLKAKGRHGTHSPFVYGFVESVLRDKREFYAFSALQKESLLTSTSFSCNKSIFRIVQYLKPDAIWLSQQGAELKNVVSFVCSKYRMLSAVTALLPGSLIILSIEELNADIISSWFKHAGHELYILVLRPHEHPIFWEEICNHPEIMLSLDLWQLGLLAKSQAFKAKQHFVLR